LLGWLLATEGLSGIGFILLGILGTVVIAALAAISWPLGAMLVLSASSAMPRFAGTVLGLHIRPEHVAIGFVTLVACSRTFQRGSAPPLRWQWFDYFLMVYVGLNFFTSAATSPEPSLTMRWATLNAIAVSPYFLIRWLIRTEDVLYRAFQLLLWVGAIESAYGIFCFLSNHLFDTSVGVEVGQYGSIPGIYGTQFEANVFGSYTACCAVMFLAYFLLSNEPRRGWYGCGFALTSMGAVISLARSVFVAFPLVAILVFALSLKRGQLGIRKVLPLAIGFGLLLVAVSPLVINLVRERFSTIDVSEISSDDTTKERLLQMAVAVEDIQARPILGTGTASFHLFFDPSDYPAGFAGDAEEPGWISNTPLRILHDTGVVGLIVFLLFVGFLANAVRKASKISSARNTAILAALSAGGLLYAITFQATEATMLAFTWVHLGLLAAAVTIVRQAQFSKVTEAK
jgi:hypothetical protein